MPNKEQEPRELKPIPVNMALEMLYALVSPDPNKPNIADAILSQYELDITILDKIPRFFIDQQGFIAYWSEFKKPIGFSHG